MKKTTILDCTLRDGGYYNNWNFDLNLIEKLIDALSKSGVDIVEMGYKSLNTNQFYGLCKYCSESQLQFLKRYPNMEYAFMLDAKEFLLADGQINKEALYSIVKSQKDSVFHWCRVASYYETIEGANKLACLLSELGYQVVFNFMGVSLLNESQIIDGLKKIKDAPFKVLYFADSFGNFSVKNIAYYKKLFSTYFKGEIGFHAHDSQGLAYANTLSAIEEGISFIDATVTGMGRGAGNLKLEQIILAMYFNNDRKNFNAFSLLDVIEKHFIPLNNKYRWGWNLSYMLSGLENLHPTYCQKLRSAHQYTMAQVNEILRGIPKENREKYNASKLVEVSNKVLRKETVEQNDTFVIPKYKAQGAESVLIVAKGPSIKEHENALKAFINKQQPLVIECNNVEVLKDIPRTIAVLNKVRLSELKDKNILVKVKEIVTGLKKAPEFFQKENLKSLNYSLEANNFEINNEKVILTSYLVGIFAVGIALLSKPKNIYVAGFDGFQDGDNREEGKEMQDFWDILLNSKYTEDKKIASILPTNYNIPVCSVYSLL
ncbi:hypothetical protein HOC37_01800 [bacterium]|jgi:4-hydroxy 2-oxovalerate aldolase|nr:hypothetical protein [bacterium]MBT3581946.1 hypothetical protein [bacterium]MBT4551701.1 hypothetical protein [bacterium]MBT7088569.1 hypothetical protein [bacterium]